jgi:predicted PurR-regulated permease PerM
MAAEPFPTRSKSPATSNWWLTVAVIAFVLWAAREVLVPLSLAILLSFVLAPLVRRLQRWRVPKGLSVGIAVIMAFAIIFGIGAFMASQVSQLAGNLPQYQSTITRKVQEAQAYASAPGSLSRLNQLFKRVNSELSGTKPPQAEAPRAPGPAASPAEVSRNRPEPPAGAAPAPTPLGGATESRPIPVEVHQPEPGGMQTVMALAGPLLHPIGTIGLVIVFVIFILLQRQDLRNRLIRLAGQRDLHRTTAAIDDAARRLSRLYLVQLGLNAGFGVVIGIGLAVIGVPSPFLWGTVAAIFRFVPYIGSLIAAVLPILLAIAVDPGWSMALWTILLFAISEPILGHLIEPMVQGQSTGLSPIAIVISAAFWTWLWGPIGLVLSIPLTVCLVVLGRHIDALHGLDVMFGDRPPLSPGETFYQRMLARDPLEAADQAETYLQDHPIEAYCDQVGLAGLRLAQSDLSRGALPLRRAQEVRDSVRELLEHLEIDIGTAWYDRLRPKADGAEEIENDADRLAREALAPAFRSDTPVLCIGGRGPIDEAAAALLAHALSQDGIGARSAGPDLLAAAKLIEFDPQGVAVVCLCSLDQRSQGSMRYAVRRLKRRLPQAAVIVGLWGELDVAGMDELRRQPDIAALTTSISECAARVRDMARDENGQVEDASSENSEAARLPGSTRMSATDAA